MTDLDPSTLRRLALSLRRKAKGPWGSANRYRARNRLLEMWWFGEHQLIAAEPALEAPKPATCLSCQHEGRDGIRDGHTCGKRVDASGDIEAPKPSGKVVTRADLANLARAIAGGDDALISFASRLELEGGGNG